MATIVDSRFRKVSKKLREIERLKNKTSLTVEERNKIANELNYKVQTKQLRKHTFIDLPDEVLNTIIEYLPINKRLAILRYKHSTDYYRQKLINLPHTKEVTKKLFTLASYAFEVIDNSLPENSDIRDRIWPFALSIFESCEEDNYPKGYTIQRFKEYFSDIINVSIKNYVRTYKLIKKPKNKYQSYHYYHNLQDFVESRMFYILKHLTVTEKYYLK